MPITTRARTSAYTVTRNSYGDVTEVCADDRRPTPRELEGVYGIHVGFWQVLRETERAFRVARYEPMDGFSWTPTDEWVVDTDGSLDDIAWALSELLGRRKGKAVAARFFEPV